MLRRHADIIFPANTALERNDLMLNPRDPTIVANKKSMSHLLILKQILKYLKDLQIA